MNKRKILEQIMQDELTLKQRKVIMYEVDQMDASEIAFALSIGENFVKKELKKSKKIIEKKLEENERLRELYKEDVFKLIAILRDIAEIEFEEENKEFGVNEEQNVELFELVRVNLKKLEEEPGPAPKSEIKGRWQRFIRPLLVVAASIVILFMIHNVFYTSQSSCELGFNNELPEDYSVRAVQFEVSDRTTLKGLKKQLNEMEESADLQLKQKKYSKAISAYKSLYNTVKKSPFNEKLSYEQQQIQLKLGFCYAKKGEYSEAIFSFEKVLKEDSMQSKKREPIALDALYYTGKVYLILWNTKQEGKSKKEFYKIVKELKMDSYSKDKARELVDCLNN